MDNLRDVMTTNVDVCTPDEQVIDAAMKMKRDDVGAIPICQDQQLLGMVTDRDIVIRCIAENQPATTKITDVMSEHLITATPDMSVQEAAQLMASKQIRRLPVVENNRLVGICALGDLATHTNSDEQAGMALSEISESTHVHH